MHETSQCTLGHCQETRGTHLLIAPCREMQVWPQEKATGQCLASFDLTRTHDRSLIVLVFVSRCQREVGVTFDLSWAEGSQAASLSDTDPDEEPTLCHPRRVQIPRTCTRRQVSTLRHRFQARVRSR
jgi:hypothetical protein